LPLGLNAEVGAAVLEGDLDLPAPDEPPEDVDGIGSDVGADRLTERQIDKKNRAAKI